MTEKVKFSALGRALEALRKRHTEVLLERDALASQLDSVRSDCITLQKRIDRLRSISQQFQLSVMHYVRADAEMIVYSKKLDDEMDSGLFAAMTDAKRR